MPHQQEFYCQGKKTIHPRWLKAWWLYSKRALKCPANRIYLLSIQTWKTAVPGMIMNWIKTKIYSKDFCETPTDKSTSTPALLMILSRFCIDLENATISYLVTSKLYSLMIIIAYSLSFNISEHSLFGTEILTKHVPIIWKLWNLHWCWILRTLLKQENIFIDITYYNSYRFSHFILNHLIQNS